MWHWKLVPSVYYEEVSARVKHSLREENALTDFLRIQFSLLQVIFLINYFKDTQIEGIKLLNLDKQGTSFIIRNTKE